MYLQKIEQFLSLYIRETNKSEKWFENRILEIKEAGHYWPTTEELVFGAQVSWRNSNKCIGRLFWKSLHVNDKRHLLDEEEIFEALLEHLMSATNGGKIRPTITVFHPNRVRIWNHQLIRYAGYEQLDGTVIGDSHSVEFTKKCVELGWHGEGTDFDVLPIMLQVDGGEPRLFDIPKGYILEVPIRHPDIEGIGELGLKWYAVPAISSMKLEIGGVDFMATPFNGWYMGTEIGARNFADESRYNMLPAVAKVLGLNMTRNGSLWKDRALVELNIAVLHSFKEDGVSIVDHHTATTQFKLFEEAEIEAGREVTGNWAWLIPPLSPAATHVFHKPYKNEIKSPNLHHQKDLY